MSSFFDSIAKSHIQNPIKSIWWSVFAKIVPKFQLSTIFAKKLHHKFLTGFQICPGYLQGIKKYIILSNWKDRF